MQAVYGNTFEKVQIRFSFGMIKHHGRVPLRPESRDMSVQSFPVPVLIIKPFPKRLGCDMDHPA
jgi:hypothetical protein